MIRDIFIVSMFSFWISCDVVAEKLQHHDLFSDKFAMQSVSNDKQKEASQHLAGVELIEDALLDLSNFEQHHKKAVVKTELSDFVVGVVRDDFFELMHYVAQSLNDHYLLVQLNIMKNSKNLVEQKDLSEFLLAWVSSVNAFIKDVKTALILNHMDLSSHFQDDVTDETVIKLLRECRHVIHQMMIFVNRASTRADFTTKLLEKLYHKISVIKADLHLVTDSVDTFVYIQILLSSIHFVLHKFHSLLHLVSKKEYDMVFDQMSLILMRFQSYIDGVAVL